jgi:hypothetical protein
MHTLQEVTSAIENSWSVYTAFDRDQWSPDNPARGQCVVSALIIQDLFGGRLQKTQVTFNGHIESHYRNVLPDGTIIDTTRSQYPASQEIKATEITLGDYTNLRQKLFAEANTESRYKLLRTTVLMKLA